MTSCYEIVNYDDVCLFIGLSQKISSATCELPITGLDAHKSGPKSNMKNISMQYYVSLQTICSNYRYLRNYSLKNKKTE